MGQHCQNILERFMGPPEILQLVDIFLQWIK